LFWFFSCGVDHQMFGAMFRLRSFSLASWEILPIAFFMDM
jgi:hypothetical protein